MKIVKIGNVESSPNPHGVDARKNTILKML